MPKKTHMSFQDLGLVTKPPALLTKTREQLKREEIEKKKQAKEQLQKVMEEVSMSRDKVNEHKLFMQREAEVAKRDKLARKYELHIKHLNARRERDAEEEAVKQETIKRTNEYITTQLRVTVEENKQREEELKVKELITTQNNEMLREQHHLHTTQQNVHVTVHRSEAIEEVRRSLPILHEEQPIMEAINNTSRTCVLVCGETGSGKTTQIPQFLWEAGYGHVSGASFGREGMILVTEPRRVAAIAMAKRVAEELNVSFGEEVCYQVRYDTNLHDGCKIKFATEGIILKEIQSDLLLKSYSVIVIDEAHERSVSCDLLIGLLSRITPLRNDLFEEELRRNNGNVMSTKIKPLRLVIMSATMRVSDFRENAKLFPISPPLISAEARRFPVSNHFSRKTELKHYVNAALEKVKLIHKKLPPGGILVFLCTQREIEQLCQKLKSYYTRTKIEYYDNAYHKGDLLHNNKLMQTMEDECSGDEIVECKETTAGTITDSNEKDEFGLVESDYDLDELDAHDELRKIHSSTKKNNIAHNLYNDHKTQHYKRSRNDNNDNNNYNTNSNDDNNEYEKESENAENEINGEYNTLHVLPLYALLDAAQQQRVFMPPPQHKRLCVIATNVAETSITIPHIRYVVDAGRVKTRMLDGTTQASCFEINWVSQASAEQRSGRAGRTGPGHCYRLYSTAVFANCMAKHSVPEILRTPLDSVVLLMKFINIHRVAGFPFPSPPQESELVKALTHLSQIGALGDKTEKYNITPLGRQLMPFPLPPRFARVIIEATQRYSSFRVIHYILAAVALTSVTPNLFTAEGNELKSRKPRQDDAPYDVARRTAIKELINNGSDLVTSANALIAYLGESSLKLCRRCCVVEKSMKEAKMLFSQLRVLTQMSSHINNHTNTVEDNNKSNNDDHDGSSNGNEVMIDENDIIDSLEQSEESAAASSTLKYSSANVNANGTNDTEKAMQLEQQQQDSETSAITLTQRQSWLQCLQSHLTREEEMTFRQLFISGLIDHVARRATVHECRSFGVEYHVTKTSKTAYLIVSNRRIAYIHPTSTVARISPPPEYLTFAFLQKVKRGHDLGATNNNSNDEKDATVTTNTVTNNNNGNNNISNLPKEAQTCMLGVTVVLEE